MRKFLPVCLAVFILAGVTSAACVADALRGSVVNNSGLPVSQARVVLVCVEKSVGREIGRAATSRDGSFRIVYPGLAPSPASRPLYLIVSSPGLMSIESVRNPVARQHIVCRDTGRISGVVRDESGRPVENAVVRPEFIIFDTFLGQQYINWTRIESVVGVKSVSTDSQGKFSVDGLPSGYLVCLRASSEGYGDALTGSGDPGAESIRPEWAVMVGDEDAEIVLSSKVQSPLHGRLEGRIIHEETREPLSGIDIIALDAGDPESGRRWNSVASSDGRFVFAEIPPGEYVLVVPEAESPVRPLPGVLVVKDETTSVMLQASPGVRVSGRVVDSETGKGVSGAWVITPGSRPALTAGGESSGDFTLSVLPGPGMLVVTGDSVGYGSTEYELDVSSGDVKDVEIRIARDPGISGRITDSSGRPVDGAYARLVTANGPGDLVQSGPKGEYHFRSTSLPLDRNECFLVAYDSASRAGAIVTLSSAGKPHVDVNIELRSEGVVSGFVRNKDGEPIHGARVIPVLAVGRHRIYSLHNRAESGKSGDFVIHGLISGAEYNVRVEADGYTALTPSGHKLPDVGSGGKATAEFTLMPEP